MSAGKAALGACRDAWRQGRVFVGAHLLARLLAYAVIAPLLGGMVNLTVSLSHQSALTDQDIAGFILTPIGFVVTVIALSILLVAEVTAFAMMTAVIRDGDGNGWRAMGRALVLALALVLGAGAVVGQTAGSLARALEMPAQRALQRLRERPDTRLAPFVTDGCSGG